MLKRYTRLLATFHIVTDAIFAAVALTAAYAIRFQAGLFPVPKGTPEFKQYLDILPFVAVLVPFSFYTQGIYRLRRGRSRVDDFFAVLVGTVLAVLLGLFGTVYVETYIVAGSARAQGALEISQLAWGLFLVINVALTYTSREVVRDVLERRWRAGIGLKRIMIAGAGELGRIVADKILEHRELGYEIVGFVDDSATSDHLGHRGLPLLGTLAEAAEIAQREQVDHLYIALPLDEHVKMLSIVEAASRECIELKVVPDLLQFIALRARLEELDGVPIISLNDVPLRGFNAVLKRVIDVALSASALAVLAIPMGIVAALIKLTSPGPVFYKQERMGLDGRAFDVYKFRSMFQHAERETGPVFASDDDPRCTPLGHVLRATDMDELPQLWNVLIGDMSLVGPRPERPYFVDQFKHRFPQYMLRHKVRAGMTGWAQVNGWRGNTSIEKRIEYDLYYIGNWSLALDLKIIGLTVVRGIFKSSHHRAS